MLRSLEAVATPATVPADLGPEAVAEWTGGPSAIATAMDEPAAGTTRALLLEIRRQTTAIVGTNKAIQRFTVLAGLGLLAILAVLLAIAAHLWQ